MNNISFYMVWKQGSSSCSKQHPSYEEAKAEAKRLAEKHISENFFVMKPLFLIRTDVVTELKEVMLEEQRA